MDRINQSMIVTMNSFYKMNPKILLDVKALKTYLEGNFGPSSSRLNKITTAQALD